MENKTLEYRMAECMQAAPIPLENCESISIQLRTNKGKTKFLAITPEEFRKIERVLAGQ